MQCIHYVLVVAILLSVNGGYSTNIDASVSTSSASKTPSVHNNFIKPTLHAIHTPSNFSNTALSDSASASASPNSSPPNSRYPFDLGNFLSHAKRVKRQSNNPLFGEFLHKMSVIARLANTILLQSDLINKTEMHYKIGELLNIGQLDIVFLKNMNTTHMLEFMEVVNKTISEIGKDVSDGENAVIYLYEMQNSMKDLPAIDKFPSRTDFSNKINELREKFEWAQFNESWPPLRKVSTVLNALNGFTNGSSTTKQMNEDVKLFTNVLDSIEYAKPFIIASNQHLTALSSFKDWNLEVRRSVMDQPERLVFSLYFRNELQKMLNASVESKYSISNKYKLIDDLKKNMQNVGDDFQTFKTNFLQYSNQPSADLRGFQALNRLSSEINEDWMDNALGMNQERRRKLIHSLNPIFALKNNSKLSNFSLSTDYKTGIAIEDMYLIADFLRERKGNSKDYDYSYTLERCLKDVGEIGWNEVSGALQSPKYSREAAEQFSILLDTKLLYEGLQPLIDDFNSVSSIINKYKDSHSSDLQFKVLTRVFDELKTSGSMEKLKKSVDRLMEFSNKFDAREFQNSLYRFLTWNEDLEGAMKSKFANEEYKFNKCFRDHEHDISMGYHDVRLLQNLRNFGEEGVNHVNAFIEKLADMKKLIDEQETTLILKNTNFNVSWEKLKTIDGAIVAKIDNAVESVKNLIELNKMEFVNKPEKMRDAIEYTNYGVDKSGTKLELEQKWKLGTGNLAFRSSSNYFKEALEKINFRKMKNISNVSVFSKSWKGFPI